MLRRVSTLWRQPEADVTHASALFVRHYLRRGAVVIDVDASTTTATLPSGRIDLLRMNGAGAERIVCERVSALFARDDAPIVLYEGRSDRTQAFGYHPVETMWLLRAHGYDLFALDGRSGLVSRRKPGHGYDAIVVAAKPGSVKKSWNL